MPDYVVPAPQVTSIAVQGEEARFPVRRIFCVSRNYAAHTREMGGDPEREAPFFFMKPADAAFDAGPNDAAAIDYPPLTSDLHHEAELTVAIGRGGRDIEPDGALDHVYGYAASIDLTRRDLQGEAKSKGRPWDWAKGFDRSAPIATIGRREDATDLDLTSAGIRCIVNGQVRQDATLGEMVWSVPEIVAAISRSVALAPGDLVMTGTPAGVGALERGDEVRVQITGLPDAVLAVR